MNEFQQKGTKTLLAAIAVIRSFWDFGMHNIISIVSSKTNANEHPLIALLSNQINPMLTPCHK